MNPATKEKTKEKTKEATPQSEVPKLVKATKLKAVVPEKLEKRLKLFIYAPSGIGKTTAAIQFPKAYIIDAERGAENYGGMIKNAGSVVFQSNNYEEIRGEVEKLLTEDHDFQTLIIDPITAVYNSLQEDWTRRFTRDAIEKNKGANADMQDFGMRFWGKVKSDFKALQRLILKLDMNVIVTSHQKDVYGSDMKKIGVTFDSMRGDDYFFDNVFRLEKRGKERYAITEKERAEIGKNKFPEEFIWSYENFLKFYGAEAIQRKAQPVKMATAEQVIYLNKMLDIVKMDEGWQDKIFAKADVDHWEEMTDAQIVKCIEIVEKKAAALKGGI